MSGSRVAPPCEPSLAGPYWRALLPTFALDETRPLDVPHHRARWGILRQVPVEAQIVCAVADWLLVAEQLARAHLLEGLNHSLVGTGAFRRHGRQSRRAGGGRYAVILVAGSTSASMRLAKDLRPALYARATATGSCAAWGGTSSDALLLRSMQGAPPLTAPLRKAKRPGVWLGRRRSAGVRRPWPSRSGR